jgi:hypothetical protein
MLEQILMDINNLFVVPDGRHAGEYSIKGGSIALDFLAPGQYFWIKGSVFNDGLHVYPAADLADEDFDGVVIAMAVPQALIALSDDIKAWVDKNGQESPYTSESFGGYSYSKATNAQGMAVGWRDVFRSRLNPWRKIKGVDI